MNLRQFLLTQKKILMEHGNESPWLDACLLAAHAFSQTKTWVLVHMEDTFDSSQYLTIESLIRRRISGESIAYIVGYKEFFGHNFVVGLGVLVPRPETEILVEWILEDHPVTMDLQYRDICTGTGCIPISIAHERPNWEIEASDISTLALSWAEKNTKIHSETLTRPLRLVQEDLLLNSIHHRRFHVISANPPYVPHGECEQKLREGWIEPMLALDGGESGTSIYLRLLEQASMCLYPGGSIYLECGDGQADSIVQLAKGLGFHSSSVRADLAGIPRICRFTTYGQGLPI